MGEAEGTAMHGNQEVSEQLNEALWSELTAAVQSMLQSEMCRNWGD